MKLPNGYGNVSKLPGKRRKPWRARKTSSWDIDEETSERLKQNFITIGYYATRQEALQALASYNENPYTMNGDITFAEVYDKWSDRKFKEISQSNVNGYKAAYKLCSTIYDMKFSDLRLSHLQGVVDSADKNPPTLKKLKILFNQMFDYAVMNEIIGKDKQIVEYVDVGKSEKSNKHFRFNKDEIDTMWLWSEKNEYIQFMLMLIYSGVRPGEMFNLKQKFVNLEEKYFYIEKGKNNNAARKVPIHEKTFPFFEHWMKKDTEYLITQLNGREFRFGTNHGQYTESYWTPLLSDMGILQYKNDKGETREHTPDDTRHTFTTMWKEKRLDESMRRKVQGHSGKGIGEIVYTHYQFEELRKELNKL